jgi:hypothetical protein
MNPIHNVSYSAGVQSLGDASAATSSPVASAPVLPEPVSFGGNTVTALAILMTQADQQDQKSSSIEQNQADAAMAQDDANRVQAMREKATQDLCQGIASGLAEIAGGALSLAGALQAPSDAANGSTLGAGGKMAAGFAPLVSAPFKAKADDDDATAAQYQAAADTDKRRYDAAQSEAQSAQDSMQKVEQYLQAILQTQEGTSLKAAGGAV